MIDNGEDPPATAAHGAQRDRYDLGVYGHLFPNAEDDLVAGLDEILGRAKTRSDSDRLVTAEAIDIASRAAAAAKLGPLPGLHGRIEQAF
ncbi:MAG: hypothetical protein M3198_15570 [Actinomycetota bacterium]|nr:hypothetical protein [Actinomycetota bacterium]